MSISITCQCGKPYTVPDTYAGRSVKCKTCGDVFRVPTQEELDFSEPASEYGVVGGATLHDPEPHHPFGQSAATGSPHWDPSLQQPSSYDPQSAWVIDQSTQASNSGRMEVDLAKYLSLHPTALVVEVLAILLGIVGALALWQPAPLIATGVGVFMLFHTLATVRGKFRTGDVNPAVVISTKPWRAAVYVDMTKGGGHRPAISIIDAPLGRMTGGPPSVGQRIAAVCLYQNGPGDAWAGVMPTIVACGVSNPAVIQRVTASISPAEWKQLDRYLGQLADRRPGIYKLWLGPNNATPSRIGALAMKGLILLACAVPVIAVVANLAKKSGTSKSDSQQVDRTQDRRRSVPPLSNTDSAIENANGSSPKPPQFKPPAARPEPDALAEKMLQNLNPPPATPGVGTTRKPKPGVADDLFSDTVGGTFSQKPDEPTRADAQRPNAATPTPDAAKPAATPGSAAPPPESAVVSPERPSLPRPPMDRTPPKPGANKGVTFSVGQKVEVYYAQRWRPARVVRMEGDAYMVALDRFPDSSARRYPVDQLRTPQ